MPHSPPLIHSEAVPGERSEMLVLLAAPRGFCAGVRRAIAAVTDAIALHGPPVYVRRAIVHNLSVVRSLEAQGAIFVEELSEVPEGAVAILSAHGVPLSVIGEARRRRLHYADAVCPLVAKVHREVVRHWREGRHVVLVGHAGHPEIVGTLGQLDPGAATVVRSAAEVAQLGIPDDAPVGYAVQTTYAVEEAEEVIRALRSRFSDLAGPPSSDICYATTNRQAAIRAIAPRADAVIVAGASFSSNACRLAEVARASGCGEVQLVADPSEIDWRKLGQVRTLGLTAAASTPESTVESIVEAIHARFTARVEEVGHVAEAIHFKPVPVA